MFIRVLFIYFIIYVVITLFCCFYSQVLDIAFEPQSKRIATASSDKTVRIWETTGDCKEISVMKGHRGEISRVTFSPVTGEYLLTASQDHTARLWKTSTGNCVQELKGHSDEVFAAVFSQCGKKIVTASKDNTAIIWA